MINIMVLERSYLLEEMFIEVINGIENVAETFRMRTPDEALVIAANYSEISYLFFNTRHVFDGGIAKFVSEIKKVNPKIKAVLMTGDPEYTKKKRFVMDEFNIDHFLEKPFSISHITDLLSTSSD